MVADSLISYNWLTAKHQLLIFIPKMKLGGKTLTCVLQIKMISVQRSPEDCKINIFSLTLCSGFWDLVSSKSKNTNSCRWKGFELIIIHGKWICPLFCHFLFQTHFYLQDFHLRNQVTRIYFADYICIQLWEFLLKNAFSICNTLSGILSYLWENGSWYWNEIVGRFF